MLFFIWGKHKGWIHWFIMISDKIVSKIYCVDNFFPHVIWTCSFIWTQGWMSWTPFLWLVSVYSTYLIFYNKAPFGASKQMSFCGSRQCLKPFWLLPSQLKSGFGNSILRRISMVNAVIASWFPKKRHFRQNRHGGTTRRRRTWTLLARLRL